MSIPQALRRFPCDALQPQAKVKKGDGFSRSGSLVGPAGLAVLAAEV